MMESYAVTPLKNEPVLAYALHTAQFICAFFYDLDSTGSTRNETVCRVYYGVGDTDVSALSTDQWLFYGELIPVFNAHVIANAEDSGYVAITLIQEGGYWYVGYDGTSITPTDANGNVPDNAGWFFDENLAPVKFDDKWGYIDRTGQLATEICYSSTYDYGTHFEASDVPTMAAHLQNGYAAVCRDGMWGLIDSSGSEVVPCEYEGAAWEGTTLWLKSDNGWAISPLASQ